MTNRIGRIRNFRLPDIPAESSLTDSITLLLTNMATTFSNVPLKRKRRAGKRPLNPGNRRICAELISCRFTGNWAGNNS